MTETLTPASQPGGAKTSSTPLVWFHVPSDATARTAEMLAKRLLAEFARIRVVITSPGPLENARSDGIEFTILDPERRADAQTFLNALAPDLCLWLQSGIDTTLMAEVDARRIPTYLLDASASDLPQRRAIWARYGLRGRLRRLRRILTADETNAAQIRNAGAETWRVEVMGKLVPTPTALPHDEVERDYLTEELSTRPVWFGTDIPYAEVTAVLEAHEATLRHAHRSLAILAPATKGAEEAILARASGMGMRVVRRTTYDVIDQEAQVLLADQAGEHGLWFRLAPQSYMGGTMLAHAGRNPFEAAALGSAIIHGPRTKPHTLAYRHLSTAGATEAIGAPHSLGAALTRLSPPDKSAALAHAAWDAVTQGASGTDRILELVGDALGLAETRL